MKYRLETVLIWIGFKMNFHVKYIWLSMYIISLRNNRRSYSNIHGAARTWSTLCSHIRGAPQCALFCFFASFKFRVTSIDSMRLSRTRLLSAHWQHLPAFECEGADGELFRSWKPRHCPLNELWYTSVSLGQGSRTCECPPHPGSENSKAESRG